MLLAYFLYLALRFPFGLRALMVFIHMPALGTAVLRIDIVCKEILRTPSAFRHDTDTLGKHINLSQIL